jgi:hypothetical protein
MTLGERITDFYYWDYVQPHVDKCIKRAAKDGFRPMPLTEEKKFYNDPAFRVTMAMPRLSIRIILQMMHREQGEYYYDNVTIIFFEQVMTALYILEGLRAWCCHRGEDIPMIGTDKKQRMAEWIEWGKQRGYIHDESLV